MTTHRDIEQLSVKYVALLESYTRLRCELSVARTRLAAIVLHSDPEASLGSLIDLMQASSTKSIGEERNEFEIDARPYGLNLTRANCSCTNPACEYQDSQVGNRWAGWLARSGAKGRQ